MARRVHQPHVTGEHRLFNLHQFAEYIGVSYWTARDYVLRGLVPTVQLPAVTPPDGSREPRAPLRRTLVDKQDADRFIDSLKGGGR
jgi:hypothetical protein